MYTFIMQIVTWIFRAVVVKFMVVTAVFAFIKFVLSSLMGWLTSMLGLPADFGLSSLFAGLPSFVLYGLSWLQIPFGFSIVITCVLARFLLRMVRGA